MFCFNNYISQTSDTILHEVNNNLYSHLNKLPNMNERKLLCTDLGIHHYSCHYTPCDKWYNNSYYIHLSIHNYIPFRFGLRGLGQ